MDFSWFWIPTSDFTCLVYSNFSANEIEFKIHNDHLQVMAYGPSLLFYWCINFEWSKHKISIVSKVKKNPCISTRNMH